MSTEAELLRQSITSAMRVSNFAANRDRAMAAILRDGLKRADKAAAKAAAVPAHQTPPDGWFVFGSFAAFPWIQIEFGSEMDEEGMPLWERPVETSSGDDATPRTVATGMSA